MGELQDIPSGKLKTGYTTGACATACVKASLLMLCRQKIINEVSIELPIGQFATFQVESTKYSKKRASCWTIKDAGDDPDVTHRAKIGAKVRLIDEKGVVFKRGDGVGLVTLSGLEIGVGEPAINPVPRQMIKAVCAEILGEFNIENKGVEVIISVENGAQLAQKTLNERLGIVGGISILGTTGIVTPFSASSYIASIEQGIDVAVANGSESLLLNSGGRSERILSEVLLDFKDVSKIHYGNWIGETLDKIQKTPQIKKIYIGMMLGKAVKLASGKYNTHSKMGGWDKSFIQNIAREVGYDEQTIQAVQNLRMGRLLVECFEFKQGEKFYQNLIKHCKNQIVKKASNVEVRFFLVGNDGDILKG